MGGLPSKFEPIGKIIQGLPERLSNRSHVVSATDLETAEAAKGANS
jgi:hypothetical protein